MFHLTLLLSQNINILVCKDSLRGTGFVSQSVGGILGEFRGEFGGNSGGNSGGFPGGIPGEFPGDFRGGIPARNSRDILRNVFFGVILTAPGTSICSPPPIFPPLPPRGPPS